MSKTNSKIAVKGVEIALNQSLDKSFISITDIAKYTSVWKISQINSIG